MKDHMIKKLAFPIFAIALAGASLACSIFVGGPDYPPEVIPVSIEAAESIKEQFKQAAEAGLTTGTLSLQLSESQLTSYLAFRLAEQDRPFMTEPQVRLRDGEMQVYGKVQRGVFLANVAIVVHVGVSEVGQPLIQVVSADFGPFPVPQGLNDAISAVVAEAYTGSLGPVATGFRMESITISGGLMTLSGRLK
jgi:hypothetical protein